MRSTYTAEEIDAVAIYCPPLNRCFYVPIEKVAGKSDLRLRLAPARNNQRIGVTLAAEYALGAIAQLGERLHGMQEVAGSSPASSTPSETAAVTVGSHEFRNRFGWYMERAAAGEEILGSFHGRPFVRLLPA